MKWSMYTTRQDESPQETAEQELFTYDVLGRITSELNPIEMIDYRRRTTVWDVLRSGQNVIIEPTKSFIQKHLPMTAQEIF